MTGTRTTRLGLLLLLPLAACAQASRPVTIKTALGELQRQLQEAGAISAVGADPERFAVAVRHAQCAAGTANPEVPLLQHDLTVDLSGSFSATGGFSVGNAVLGSGTSFGLTRGQTQQLTLPLTFVALSEIPDYSAAQRLEPLAALPKAVQAPEVRAIVRERDALRGRIDALIEGWAPGQCRSNGTQVPVLQPNALGH